MWPAGAAPCAASSKRAATTPRNLAGASAWESLAVTGATGNGAMGAVPLQFTEIDAWARLNRLTLERWEVKALRSMSIGYVNEISNDDDAQEPMLQTEMPSEELMAAKAAITERRLEQMFARLEAQENAEMKRRRKKQ